jgi:hypothetical protein
LESNISCNVQLLNGFLETDDAIVVSAGKLRKLWDSPSELRSSLCERRLEKDSSETCAYFRQNCAVYSVFPSGMTSAVNLRHGTNGFTSLPKDFYARKKSDGFGRV